MESKTCDINHPAGFRIVPHEENLIPPTPKNSPTQNAAALPLRGTVSQGNVVTKKVESPTLHDHFSDTE